MEQSTFDQIRTRPRFKIYSSTNREAYTAHLQQFIKENRNFVGKINADTALIRVKTEHSAYWKPYLELRTEFDSEENKTVIRGVFGPSSAVWTFFMFMYFILSISWMVLFTLWYVSKQIKHDGFSWALPLSFGFLALLLILYFAGRIGRQKAKPEMSQLRDFALNSTLQLEK